MAGDPAMILPLTSELRPILTPGMQAVFAFAQRAAEKLAAVPSCALVVDLDGPDSVAFAAGAVSSFDPVFLFDNWPHPRGVVPAHLTLAAAAYYQPMLVQAAVDGGWSPAPPMFVLDRQRLSPYVDSADRFDNRWVARLPGVQALRGLGVRRVLYVAPAGTSHELDDLNDAFVADVAAGIAISMIDVTRIDAAALATDYVPVSRRTPFSSGAAGGGRPTPSEFGTVPVAVSVETGVLLGVAWSRSGTWNRGWGGGG
jgi:hypothetical protein